LTSPPDLGDIVGDEYMARLGLQRQAEAEIALEFGGDLGVSSDGSPVFRDERGFRSIQPIIALTLPELNRSSSDATMPSGSVVSE
jgi:hypothetical protein